MVEVGGAFMLCLLWQWCLNCLQGGEAQAAESIGDVLETTKMDGSTEGGNIMQQTLIKSSEHLEEKHNANPPSWHANCQCFLHQQDIGWSRSRFPVLRWSGELWRTTKHTVVYPSSGPVGAHKTLISCTAGHLRTTCATTCLVWNDSLTNLVCYRLCVVLGWVGMAPIFVISLCDILSELHEPHGARGATLCGKP
jgi:hypothetical protein